MMTTCWALINSKTTMTSTVFAVWLYFVLVCIVEYNVNKFINVTNTLWFTKSTASCSISIIKIMSVGQLATGSWRQHQCQPCRKNVRQIKRLIHWSSSNVNAVLAGAKATAAATERVIVLSVWVFLTTQWISSCRFQLNERFLRGGYLVRTTSFCHNQKQINKIYVVQL